MISEARILHMPKMADRPLRMDCQTYCMPGRAQNAPSKSDTPNAAHGHVVVQSNMTSKHWLNTKTVCFVLLPGAAAWSQKKMQRSIQIDI
mmetsp:Transcript_49725/g.90958  ORF Transcript_49725/g.90958 Transcript_49725/m.90958 type:complete len:90 (+) Transcript_49725:1-270(+)